MKYCSLILVLYIFAGCSKQDSLVSASMSGELNELLNNIRKHPNNSRFQFELASYYFSSNKKMEGRGVIEKLYLADSLNFGFNLKSAQLYLNNSLFKEAMFHALKCNQIDSSIAAPFFVLGKINIVLGDFKKAFNYINNGLRIDQFEPEGYFLKGVIYKHTRDTFLAVSSFKTATELHPGYYQAFNELGLLLTMKGDSTGYQYYKNSVECSPSNKDGLYGYSWSLMTFGKHRDAIAAFKKCLILNEKDTNALYNLSVLYLGEGELDSGMYYLNKTLSIDSTHKSSIVDLEKCYEILADTMLNRTK